MSSLGVAMPLLLFFLKAVRDEYCLLELDRVDRSVCTALLVFNNFQHTSTVKAFKYLDGLMLSATLGNVHRVAEKLDHFQGERHQILFGASYPLKQPVTIFQHSKLYVK
jgi:hypothetical protein